METAVKSSVADSVRDEFKSYSSVVSAYCLTANLAAPVIRQLALRSVVKSVVEEEEELETRISEVLEEVGLMPKLEAQRIGRKKSASVIRPVKVCVSVYLAPLSFTKFQKTANARTR